MIDVYENLSIYRDKGIRTTYFYKENKVHHKDIQKFSTYYKKPDVFKFEWINNKYGLELQFNYIESVGGETHIKKWGKDLSKYNNINQAISRITGTTGRAVYWLPRIMMKDIFCPDLRNEKLEFIGNEIIAGNDNVIIEIDYKSEGVERIWIDQDKYTVTKIVSKSEIEGYSVTDEIIYKEVEIKGS